MDSGREDFANNIEVLKAALVGERGERIIEAARAARAEAELAVARAKASDDQALIAHQQLRIEKLTRQLYGPRAERTSRILDQIELRFEELESSATEDEIAAEMAVAETTTVAAFTRKRPARKPLPEHLPRERVIVPGPTTCLCCGGKRLRKLGETVTETLESIPRQWKVIQHVREKFTCRDCEKISQAPAPFHVIARGWAGPSLLAMILFEKFGQHQPLNRQAERYAKEGVPLSLSTLADQVGAGCARCWNRSSGVLKRMSSRRNDCTVMTPLYRSWRRAKLTPADVGFMCATIARSAAPRRRRQCSITRATERANIPRRISPTTPGFSKLTHTADTTSCTSPIAKRGRSWKQPAGCMLAVRSSSWRMWPRMPVARRKAKPRRRSRRWPWRRSGASMPYSRSNARSTARVPSNAELSGRSSARHWSLIWKAGCASNAPSSRAATKSPKRWSTCSNVGPHSLALSMTGVFACQIMPRKERCVASPWVGSHGYSPAPIAADSALPPCTASSSRLK